MPATTLAGDASAFRSLVATLNTDAASLLSSTTVPLASHLPQSSGSHSVSNSNGNGNDGSRKGTLTPTSMEPLLTLKSALLLSYSQHLVLLSSHRLLGRSLADDEQGRRLVQNLVRMRLVLEKMKPVESRSTPKWERYIRAYEMERKRGVAGGAEVAARPDGVVGDKGEEEEEDAGELCAWRSSMCTLAPFADLPYALPKPILSLSTLSYSLPCDRQT